MAEWDGAVQSGEIPHPTRPLFSDARHNLCGVMGRINGLVDEWIRGGIWDWQSRQNSRTRRNTPQRDSPGKGAAAALESRGPGTRTSRCYATERFGNA